MIEWWEVFLLCSLAATGGYILCSVFAVGRWSDYAVTGTDPEREVAAYRIVQANRSERRREWRDSWKHF